MAQNTENRNDVLTLVVEFPKDVRLTEAQKAYICEEVARLAKGLINSMTFEKRSGQIENETNIKGDEL